MMTLWQRAATAWRQHKIKVVQAELNDLERQILRLQNERMSVAFELAALERNHAVIEQKMALR